MIGAGAVWQSLLLAVIRFLDNRFQRRPNQLVLVLEREIEKRDRIIEYYQEAMVNLASSEKIEVQEEEAAQEFKPLTKPHWRSVAADLERKSREQRARMDAEVPDPSIAKLEDELGV